MEMNSLMTVALSLVLITSEGAYLNARDQYVEELPNYLNLDPLQNDQEALKSDDSAMSDLNSQRKLICFSRDEIEASNQLEKRFMRFGKSGKAQGQTGDHEDSEYDHSEDLAADKRNFLRFGKRFMRFGKRSVPKRYCVWL